MCVLVTVVCVLVTVVCVLVTVVCVLVAVGGHVLSWGQNTYKQLGLGEGNSVLVDTPTRVELLQGVPIKQISSGGYHTFVLSLSGCLYGWGSNR